MSVTNHAFDRALSRVADAGISPRAVMDRAAKAAHYVPDESAALHMLRLKKKVGDSPTNFSADLGDYEGRDSNGDDLWAIVRRSIDGVPDPNGVPRVTTFFWRRSEQPATPERLKVSKVYYMKGATA